MEEINVPIEVCEWCGRVYKIDKKIYFPQKEEFKYCEQCGELFYSRSCCPMFIAIRNEFIDENTKKEFCSKECLTKFVGD